MLRAETHCWQWASDGSKEEDDLVVHAIVPMSQRQQGQHSTGVIPASHREFWKVICENGKLCSAVQMNLQHWDLGQPLAPTDTYALTGHVTSRTKLRWVVSFGEMNRSELTVDFDKKVVTVENSEYGALTTGNTECGE